MGPRDQLARMERWRGGGHGYSADELDATIEWWSERVHPEDLPRIKASLEQVLASPGTSWNGEYRFRLGDGNWAIFHDRAFITRDESGNAVHLLGAISDVTEHRVLQEKLQISDRMACVGTLAAGVAHEINNPLTYIKSNLDFVLSELKDSTALSADVTEALRDALEGAERVRHRLRDEGIFAGRRRSPADRAGACDRPEPPNDPQRGAAQRCAGEGPRQHAEGDGQRVKTGQVVLNLLVNAAHAMRGGQTDQNRLWLRTYTSNEGDAVIEVEDTGPGIPRDLRRKVFDPFFTTKAIGEGTGLGLSICHGLVTGMGGEITIEDGARGGCLIRVKLPAAPCELLALRDVSTLDPQFESC